MSLKEDIQVQQRQLTKMYKAMGMSKQTLINVLRVLVVDPDNDEILKWHIELINEVYDEDSEKEG